MACGRQFRGGRGLCKEKAWKLYLEHKQTASEIGALYGVSASTVRRRLAQVSIQWEQPRLKGEGCIHLDATYFSRSRGVLVALETGTGRLMYMAHIGHERRAHYEAAVRHIVAGGYKIRGLVMDGIQRGENELSAYPIQMCHFHAVALVRRKLTMHPKLPAAKELLDLVCSLKSLSGSEFKAQLKA